MLPSYRSIVPVVLKLLGSVVILGISLLAVAIGLALLANRKRLADRLQQYQERDAVGWTGSIALRHSYFKGVVRLYALGLIAWGAFYPSLALTLWLNRATAGASQPLPVLVFLGMFGIAFAMSWHSQRAMTALGLPFPTFGLRPLRSVPWQVNATFWGLVFLGVLVDFVAAETLRIS